MSRLEKAVEAVATLLESQVGFGWFAWSSAMVMVALVLLRWAA